MHRYRIYVPIEPRTGIVHLRNQVAHRLLHVLRVGVGHEVLLTDGNGHEMHARVIHCDRRNVNVSVEIEKVCTPNREPTVHVSLFAAVLKGEKFEWLIQKAVELGVREIMPMFTKRTIVRLSQQKNIDRQQRWQAIAIHAMEQCGGCQLPVVEMPCQFDEALTKLSRYSVRLIPYEGERERSLCDVLLNADCVANGIAIIIGPEGGFASDEVRKAQDVGAIPVTLGRRILRAETAAIVTVALVLSYFKQLG